MTYAGLRESLLTRFLVVFLEPVAGGAGAIISIEDMSVRGSSTKLNLLGMPLLRSAGPVATPKVASLSQIHLEIIRERKE
jgi:hypothetical protein